MEYAQRRGTLNVGLRFEAHIAQALTVIFSCLGVKRDSGAAFKLEDFAPHLGDGKKPPLPEEVDDALMAFFGKSTD